MSEKKFAEIFPPGEFIKEELEARNWSQIDLAEIIGRHPNVINELIAGKRSVTPETARALGDAFGTSAQYWMNLESAYQLWHLKSVDNVIPRRSKLYQIAPIKEMVKRHWIEPSESIDVLEKRVMLFFEMKDLDRPIKFAHAARKGPQDISPSQLAWLFRAKQMALGVHAKPFTEKSFHNALTALKNLLNSAQEIRHVPKILSDNGIRFLILEHLPKTRIDGVTFWLDNKSPVIALSLRFDRIDWFWYTLAHELGHVNHRDGLNDGVTLDIDLVGSEGKNSRQQSEAEKLADEFATEYLIEQASLKNFILRVHPLYGKEKIINFARKIGVHPGIVVGQLQHRQEIPWSSFRLMLEKVKDIIIPASLTDGWGQITPIQKD
jgi:HTH-type transcriptional regulator/antitoxin HigA